MNQAYGVILKIKKDQCKRMWILRQVDKGRHESEYLALLVGYIKIIIICKTQEMYFHEERIKMNFRHHEFEENILNIKYSRTMGTKHFFGWRTSGEQGILH